MAAGGRADRDGSFADRLHLDELRSPPEAVLDWMRPEANVIIAAGNGEPQRLLDALEAHADGLCGVRIHQMRALRARSYIEGAYPGLRDVSWFLSPHTRDAFHRGACDLVPNSFSDVPRLMRQSVKPESS